MDRKLIYTAGKWQIAELVDASKYGRLGESLGINGGKVWADPESTAFICSEAEPRAVSDLPPPPPTGA